MIKTTCTVQLSIAHASAVGARWSGAIPIETVMRRQNRPLSGGMRLSLERGPRLSLSGSQAPYGGPFARQKKRTCESSSARAWNRRTNSTSFIAKRGNVMGFQVNRLVSLKTLLDSCWQRGMGSLLQHFLQRKRL